jgi:glyoxylase-like metal-dependent hydrolase (beta-lactamase superfamily II)
MGKGVRITVFNTGWVKAPNRVVLSGGSGKTIDMPALCALIRHPEKGNILYDTGYSTRFYDATEKWPYRIMRHLTPARVKPEDHVEAQLEKMGVSRKSVRRIILGHGHVDHAPGLPLFPDATVVVEKREWAAMNRPAWAALSGGYIRDLYKGGALERQIIDMETQGVPLGPFRKTVDLFGDGTLVLVDLPGHTAGQMGLIATIEDGSAVFFIGDAGWVSGNFVLNRTPSQVIRLFVDSFRNFKQSLQSIHDFHKMNPDVLVVPTHCPDAWRMLKEKGLGIDNHE